MYSDRWSSGLRQGDILGQIFFPSLGAEIQIENTVRSLVPGAPASPPVSVTVPGDLRFVVVVSHDCEFNEEKRNKLLLARIQSVPGNLTPEQVDALRESNDVDARAKAGEKIAGVDTFLLAPVPGAFADERVGVFTTITPFPMKMMDGLVKTKRAEMDDEHRVLFRGKLALFVGRHADDIADDMKFDRPGLDEGEA